MSLHYFELLEATGSDPVRLQMQENFMANPTFAQLVRIINSDRNYNLSFDTVVDMFKYFNVELNYEDDMFVRTQLLRNVEVEPEFKGPYTKFQTNTPIDKSLLYIMTMQGVNKHKTYYYLKGLLERCDQIEFIWCMRIIGNRLQLRKLVRRETE